MEVLDSRSLTQVSAGNLVIPFVSAIAIGASIEILSWTIQTSYKGDTEAFDSWQNFAVEGFVGASIATIATLCFVFAT